MAPGLAATATEVKEQVKLAVGKGDDKQTQSQQQQPDSLANISTGGYKLAGVPQIQDPYAKRQWQLEHMAGAFRVFARKGFTEGLSGHISVRDPVDRDTFWINPWAKNISFIGKHFGMLKASDMVHIDHTGAVIGGNRVAVNAAGFQIHAAVHRRRPDVDAACHTHSRAGKAWSAFARPLDIINQDAATFWHDQAVYEGYGGVALAAEEGDRIAAALGPTARTAMLRNHGLLTCGSTVDEAAFLFTLADKSCDVQLSVEAAGLPKILIDDEEAEHVHAEQSTPDMLYAEFQPDLEYEVWKSHGELSLGEQYIGK